METVSLSRSLAAPPDAVRAEVLDVEPFMRAAGFSTVERDGEELTIGKGFAMASIELELRLLDDADAVLAYEQRDGIFEEMWTGYTIEPTDDGCEITATTEFALDVGGVGAILDGTVIRRQRTKELTAQFDYLAAETGE
ncbi:SRPBCC family protein [Halorientalis brevis]|uniref:SRPBCC family protein n=1 Tax=Halorientalis brevis TaxID=1126241 RepID=A0ABD6CDH0_9EURY|nr:SRPBCC family protein [Halorientalis brevis]